MRFKKIKLPQNKLARWLVIAGGVLVLLFVIGLVVAFSMRGRMLDRAVVYAKEKVKREYDWDLNIAHYELDGWTKLNMSGIVCTNSQSDTVLSSKNVEVGFRLWPLLRKEVQFTKIAVNGTLIDVNALLYRDTLKKDAPEPQEITDSTSKYARLRDYAVQLHDYIQRVPGNLELTDAHVRYEDTAHYLLLSISEARLRNNDIEASMVVNYDELRQPWTVEGKFNPDQVTADVTLQTTETKIYDLKMLKELISAEVGFRKVHFELEEFEEDAGKLNVVGGFLVEDAAIYKDAVSEDTIRVQKGGLKFDLALGPDGLQFQKGTEVVLNDLVGDLQATYRRKPEVVQVALDVHKIDANKFLQSLPEGMFILAKQMKVKGSLDYDLAFYIDLENKDTISINSSLKGDNIKITDPGPLNLAKLNGSFSYTPYNRQQSFLVGEENPDYVPLDQINPLLPAAVITAEDPRFYSHEGFEPRAFEMSFLTDLQEGEFKRGGSTISMQLVKNVFLNHKKTIDRKLEELLLVWFIEKQNLVPKRRMLEVYLNVIEWGPGIYGIGPASRYYFNVHPSELTRSEAVFLASIIPSPRRFMYRFDAMGNLRPYAASKVRAIDRFMVLRGLAPPADSTYDPAFVYISGPARGLMNIMEPPQVVEEEEKMEEERFNLMEYLKDDVWNKVFKGKKDKPPKEPQPTPAQPEEPKQRRGLFRRGD